MFKTFESPITSLKENEVFVFGSNSQGFHKNGAALNALVDFGAQMGQGYGPQGNTYAIATVVWRNRVREKVSLSEISNQLIGLFVHARLDSAYSGKTFLLTDIGTGLAGFSYNEIARCIIEALLVTWNRGVHVSNPAYRCVKVSEKMHSVLMQEMSMLEEGATRL